jgi:hypothetical protein
MQILQVSDSFHLDFHQIVVLHCRIISNSSRLPRGHPEIEQPLSVLLKCVERMPASGRLFTSQSPLSPIFIAGLVACHSRERLVVEQWFRTVTSTGSRSVRLLFPSCCKISLTSTQECPSLMACFTDDLGLDGYHQSTCTRSK